MKIGLDINHYRSKREANLTALAKASARRWPHGRGHTLEPMNPYERRIIHSAISEMEGVKSESIGEGANRRVVISSTNPAPAPRGITAAAKAARAAAPQDAAAVTARAARARPAKTGNTRPAPALRPVNLRTARATQAPRPR